MAFKLIEQALFLALMLIQIVSCQNRDGSQKTMLETSNEENMDLVKQNIECYANKDTFVFSTAKKEYIYTSDRLFPDPKIPDSINIVELLNSNVLSIELVNDTIFAFFNNDLLHTYQNNHLPQINDSLLRSYYSNFYNITVDDDIPYFIYLENAKDLITLTKDRKKDIYIWETATIQDTILNIAGIKVGMEKNEVFSKLGFPNFKFGKKTFSLILCHASIPQKIWYKSALQYIGNGAVEKLESVIPNLKMLLHFKDNRLEYFYIDDGLGYGKKIGSNIKIH